jgi:hypothetical protein
VESVKFLTLRKSGAPPPPDPQAKEVRVYADEAGAIHTLTHDGTDGVVGNAVALDGLTDVDTSGGSEGDVLTQQGDGSFALEAPSGGSQPVILSADLQLTNDQILNALSQEAVKAQGTMTLDDQPGEGNSFTIGGFTYTFVTGSPGNGLEIQIGATLTDSKANLVTAVSAFGEVQLAAFGGNDSLITANDAGADGNSIALSSTEPNLTFDAAFLGATTEGLDPVAVAFELVPAPSGDETIAVWGQVVVYDISVPYSGGSSSNGWFFRWGDEPATQIASTADSPASVSDGNGNTQEYDMRGLQIRNYAALAGQPLNLTVATNPNSFPDPATENLTGGGASNTMSFRVYYSIELAVPFGA